MKTTIILTVILTIIARKWVKARSQDWTSVTRTVWWPWQNKWDDRKSE